MMHNSRTNNDQEIPMTISLEQALKQLKPGAKLVIDYSKFYDKAIFSKLPADLQEIEFNFRDANKHLFMEFVEQLKSVTVKPKLIINFEHNNYIGEDEIAALIRTIGSSKFSGLVLMNMNPGKINSAVFEEISGALASGLMPEHVGIILIGTNVVTLNYFQKICEALASGNAPKHLKLDFSIGYVNDEYMQYLAEAIESGQLPQNLELVFMHTDISDVGIGRLAKALTSGKAPCGLKLNLTSNKFSDKGFVQLANMLKSPQAPEQLTLTLGGIQSKIDNGAKALVEALQPNNGQQPNLPKGLHLSLDLTILTPMIALGFTGKSLPKNTLEEGVILENLINSNTIHNQKIKSLKKVCESYLTYLQGIQAKAQTGKLKLFNHQNPDKKINAVKELIATLNTDSLNKATILDNFSKALNKNKPILEKARDTETMVLLKRVATILSLGIASLLGIWKVKGSEVCKEMESVQSANNLPK